MSFAFGKNGSEDNSKKPSEFSSNKKSTASQVYLGSGTEIEGSFKFEGDAVVNCKLKGNVTAQSKFVLGSEGEIDGNITGQDITIEGKVTGDVDASSKLCLKRPASIQGNLNSPKISIEDGVVFNGNISMRSPGEVFDLKRESSI